MSTDHRSDPLSNDNYKPESKSLKGVKWPEVWSLAFLNAAIVISWIAYHEYQPKLLAGYGMEDMAIFLIYAKSIILVVIPPVAGLLSDYFIRKNNKVYIVFLAGIGMTAMIFMIVASALFQGPSGMLTPVLPLLIILWLIGMNIFQSPANSLIDMFASIKNLPVVMGVLVFVTEFLYALEPVVVSLVDFLGATLTFTVGGLLIAGSGFLFQKVSQDEVLERKEEQMKKEQEGGDKSDFLVITAIGLIFGVGHAFMVEFLPDLFIKRFNYDTGGGYFSSFVLICVALLALPISRYIVNVSLGKYAFWSCILIIISILLIVFVPFQIIFIIGIILIITGFSILSVSSLPLVIRNLTIRKVTLGVGIFYGIASIADGIADIIKGI